ncbi:MAG: hypothetical protein MSA98_11335 [Spirochaetia bacterium]|nr:hypothetical protein [Spirochaetia bacterium]
MARRPLSSYEDLHTWYAKKQNLSNETASSENREKGSGNAADWKRNPDNS